MGKSKSKKRKHKLARPPKKKAPKLGIEWEHPTLARGYDLEMEDAGESGTAAPGELDAPSVPWVMPGAKRPFGAVDPSMHGSTRYRKFRDAVAAIRQAVPDSMKTFATYDVPDLKQRRWLTRFCLKKEAGDMADWQQLILEKAGFNWKRGHKPTDKSSKGKGRGRGDADRVSGYEAAWTQAYEALRDRCSAESPALAMAALLQCDDAQYAWLRKQIVAKRAGKLKPERMAGLQALPFDFDAVASDRGFSRWRAGFKAYAADKLENTGRWAATQRQAKKAGKLPASRIEALDAIGFDWSVAPETSGLFKMEARWRAKLEHYLALEAVHGKPLPMQIEAAKPLRSWRSRMREHYKKGELRPELIAEFEARGFVFSGIAVRRQKLSQKWQEQFTKLEKFKERFGHVLVPSSYADDPELGIWLVRQRERWRRGKLKGEKPAKLQAVGVEPTGKDHSRPGRSHLSPWLKIYRQIVAFLEAEHGGRMPEVGHISHKHRTWLKRQRDKMKAGKLESWQLERLDAIGFKPEALPEPPPPVDWGERIGRLRRFVEKYGHARVARSCPDTKLYAFVQNVRLRKRKGKLSPAEERDLEATGFSFDPYGEVSPAWMRYYEVLKHYHQRHGDSHVPRNYSEDQGLAEFVAQQKQRGRKGRLLAEHIRLLDALDFPWSGGHPVGKDE